MMVMITLQESDTGGRVSDIDECRINNGNCGRSSKCRNVPGGRKCDCDEGCRWSKGTCRGKYSEKKVIRAHE